MGDDICTIDPATVSLVEFNLIEDSQWTLDNPADREEGAEETMVLGQDARGDVRWTAIPYMRDELNPNSKAYFYGLTFYEPNTPDPDPDPNPNPDPDPVIDPTPDPDPVPDPDPEDPVEIEDPDFTPLSVAAMEQKRRLEMATVEDLIDCNQSLK